MITKSLGNIRYVDGVLAADVAEETILFNKPCDAAALCGPRAFVFNDNMSILSPYAECVIKLAEEANQIIPLRGEYGDFIMFAVFSDTSFSIAALSRKSTTLTVRVEDVWEKLPPEKRAYSYICNVNSSTVPTDCETTFSVAPDARIFLDLNDCDGFILNFSLEAKSND